MTPSFWVNSAPRIGVAILAAGQGTRLAPLTTYCPKPLVPFQGRPILAHLDTQLAALSNIHVGINAFHLAHELTRWVQVRNAGQPEKRPWQLVRETHLSGSGGGLRAIANAIAGWDHLIYINGDIISDFPLQTLVDTHLQSRHAATMLVVPGALADNNVGFDQETQRIATLPMHDGTARDPALAASPLRQQVSFGGYAIFQRALIERMPALDAPCLVRDLLSPALQAGTPIGALYHRGFWADLGTPARLFNALETLGQHPVDGAFPDEYCAFLPEAITLRDGQRSQIFKPRR